MSRSLSPDVLVYDLVHAIEPQVSPDGTRIVYALRRADREAKKESCQLWICDLDGDNARQFTWSGANNGGARWSPDGSQIAFTSDRGETGSRLFILPVATLGEAREITRHRSGISDLAWSPDGRLLAYTTTFDPNNPDETAPPADATPAPRVVRRLDYKRDGLGFIGDARAHIFVVETITGYRRRLTSAVLAHRYPRWSPDGRWLAIAVWDLASSQSHLLLIDVETQAEIAIRPEHGHVGLFAWDPSGSRLLYSASSPRSPYKDYFIYDMTRGASRRITTDLDWLAVDEPVWLDPSTSSGQARRVLLHGGREGASELVTLDTATGAVTTIQRWEALHGGLSTDAARRWVVQTHASPQTTGEISVHDLQSGATRIVTRHNTAVLADTPPARAERLRVERDGLTIHGWLYSPPDRDPTQRYPVVVDVHGGPQGCIGAFFEESNQLLATNGFLVVAVDPRGSTSYGRDFAERVVTDYLEGPYADIVAVLDQVLERPYADPARVGLIGGSYGAHLISWAIGRTPRFAAAVCWSVTFDLEAQYLSADADFTFGDTFWGGPPWQNRAWYDANSPSTFAHQVRTPTLILHGEADDRCPIGQAEEMFTALKKAGCEVEFVRYPGGTHLLAYTVPPELRVDYFGRCLSWFQTHLGAAT